VNRWPEAAVAFLMLAGGFALLVFGRYLARGKPDYLTDFLRQNLDARAC
jgi:hypothetical protein